MRVAPQAVLILRAPSKLNHFQRAAQIHVQALLFGFAIQRSGTMQDRIRRVHQRAIVFVAQAKAFTGQVAAKNAHARIQVFQEFREREMQLQRLPQPLARFLFGFCTHQ